MSSKPRLLIFIVAYQAERTIDKVIRRIPETLSQTYDVEILVIDDSSRDGTFSAGVTTSADPDLPFKLMLLFNPVNQGYGGNQKIGYHYAIEKGFDFVGLIHGDGQYAPELLAELVEPLRRGEADAVFGSRMLRPKDALKGGMPYYKFLGNRILTYIQNRLLGARLSEFHSGYRIYATKALRRIPFDRNSNGFHFDTEIIIQLLFAGQCIKEIPIPTYYGDEICYVNGLGYAAAVVKASLQARLQRSQLFYDRRFDCAAVDAQTSYPSKTEFDSSHAAVVALVPFGVRVLDLGAGSGAVGAALKTKGCYVVGCDQHEGELTHTFDRFFLADLDREFPDLGDESFDYILVLDVVEHLRSPELFLDQLRYFAAVSPRTHVVLSTANVGFIAMRASLLLGRFEYGKRGILDLTHTRLFTKATFRRVLTSAGFDVGRIEGVPVPLPFLFSPSSGLRAMMLLNGALARAWPAMFGFQLLAVARPRPSLEMLLRDATASAEARREHADKKLSHGGL